MSLAVATSPELSLVFPTPILVRTLFTGSFNDRLARTILHRRRHGAGLRLSGGGWQSDADLLRWPDLEVKILVAEVIGAAQRINAAPAKVNGDGDESCVFAASDRVSYRGCAWANVNGDGHYNTLSTPTLYQWCAIYHVATGRPAADRVMNGKLELLDPRPAAPFANLKRFAFGQPLEIEPKPGLIVIFPAWLQYCVHPFFGMGHRISITMNITFDET